MIKRKARPILFSGPMVRALLEGRKTQTRRIIKPQPETNPVFRWNAKQGSFRGLMSTSTADGVKRMCNRCPYGQPGDLLWVRETWAHYQCVNHVRRSDGRAFSEVSDGLAGYRADGHDTIEDFQEHVRLMSDCSLEAVEINGDRWRPSIHMPRWASRLTLELTDVRVQRAQDISSDDAVAEGATKRTRCCGFRGLDDGWSMDWSLVGMPSKWGHDGKTLSEGDIALASPRSAFGSYINELHDGRYWSSKPEKPLWDQNPYLWVLTFTVHQQNVASFDP